MKPPFCKLCKQYHPLVQICRDQCRNKTTKCKNKYIPGCSVCKRCTWCGCCCAMCQVCKKQTVSNNICTTCSKALDVKMCRAHCKCRKMKKRLVKLEPQVAVVKVKGIPFVNKFGAVIPKTHEPQVVVENFRKFNKLSRPIGFEAEIAEWRGLEQWRGIEYDTEHDGSVKPSGRELQVAPAAGDKLVNNILQLGEAIVRYNSSINETCGFHVHVDGGDLSWWEIRRLLLLWNNIEDSIFNYLCESNRKENRYCSPLNSNQFVQIGNMFGSFVCIDHKVKMCKRCATGELKRKIFEFMYGRNYVAGWNSKTHDYITIMKSQHKQRQTKQGGNRYQALNLQSWMLRGSVEFRLKEGLTDAKEMLMWCLFCGWVVEAVGRLNDEAVKKITTLRKFVNVKVNGFSSSEYLLPEFLREWVKEKIAARREE